MCREQELSTLRAALVTLTAPISANDVVAELNLPTSKTDVAALGAKRLAHSCQNVYIPGRQPFRVP